GEVKVWDTQGQRVHALTMTSWFIPPVAFTPDGRCLAAAAKEGRLEVWDVGATAKVLDLEQGDRPEDGGEFGFPAVFSPDGQALAFTRRDGTLVVCNTTMGQEVLRAQGKPKDAVTLALSSDGRQFAYTASDQTLKCLETATGREIFASRGEHLPTFLRGFSTDGRFL